MTRKAIRTCARCCAGSTAYSGTFRSGLRFAALASEAGRARLEKREEASHHRNGQKAGGVAASPSAPIMLCTAPCIGIASLSKIFPPTRGKPWQVVAPIFPSKLA